MSTTSQDNVNIKEQFVADMPFGVAMLDATGRVTFSNSNLAGLIEQEPDDTLGRHFTEFIHPDDRAACLVGFANVVEASGDHTPTSLRLITPTGSSTACMANAFALRDDNEELRGFYALVIEHKYNNTLQGRSIAGETVRKGAKAIIITDPEGRVREASDSTLSLLGLTREAIIGKLFPSFFNTTKSNELSDCFKELASGDERFIKLVGDSKIQNHKCKLSLELFADGPLNGRVEDVLVFLEDASLIISVEEKHSLLESRFNALLDSDEQIVFEMNTSGILSSIYSSPEIVEKYLGYQPTELIGMPFPPYVDAEDLPKATALVKKIRDSKSVESYEPINCRIRRRDGQWRLFSVYIKPTISKVGEDTKPKSIFGVLKDITEVTKNSKRLAESDSLMGMAFESIHLFGIICDANLKLTGLSRACENATGYTRASRIGMSLDSILVWDKTHDEFIEFIQKATQTNDRFTLKFLVRNGEPRVVSLGVVSYKNELGEVAGYSAFGYDITEELRKKIIETERNELALEVAELKREMQGLYGPDNFIGRSAKMCEVYDTIHAVSRTNATVLIHGETGTGKDLVSRAIHYNSSRRDAAFVKVDCGALAETLLESELFGHVRGAFTGAIKTREGRFELANKGTIFLDEVQNLPMPLQAKLLRVVQDGSFEKVGGTNTINVDVRIVAATNENLEAMVEDGAFRKDLYYRLNVIPIILPPLRERVDDISLLAQMFLERFAKRHEKDVKGFASSALDKLMSYSWPGNVRELENIIEQAIVFAADPTIVAGNIRLPESNLSKIHNGESSNASPSRRRKTATLRQALASPEKQILLDAIEEASGNRKKAAEILGISRSAFYEKLKRHGVERRKRT